MQDSNRILSRIAEPLLDWYDRCARSLPWRETRDPYRIWISEIMLQQTRVQAVMEYYRRFLEFFPDVYALASAPEEQVLKLWEGLGYYSRARNLQKAAQTVAWELDGKFPAEKKDLMKLPGIGEYTAGAVSSIAFGRSEPAVDGNVLRVAARLLASKDDVSAADVKKEVTEQIRSVIPPQRAGDFNQALMDLGATVCLPNGVPLCEGCPLAELCEGNRKKLAADLPIKAPKKERTCERRTVFVIVCADKAAFCRRPDRGLLAGMWELPNTNGELTRQQAEEQLKKWGFSAPLLSPTVRAKHIFTHREWQMSGWFVRVSQQSRNSDFLWADWERISHELSVPSAFSAYMTILQRGLKET